VGALVLTTAAPLAQIPAAAVFCVPMMQWLALPSCLCGISPTDPRLILLRTLETGVGEPSRPVDCIVFAVTASVGATVQRALNLIAPLMDRLAPLRIDQGSMIATPKDANQPTAAGASLKSEA
jgi:hypothetical protein